MTLLLNCMRLTFSSLILTFIWSNSCKGGERILKERHFRSHSLRQCLNQKPSNELKKDMVKVAHTNQHHLKNHSGVSANCTKTMVWKLLLPSAIASLSDQSKGQRWYNACAPRAGAFGPQVPTYMQTEKWWTRQKRKCTGSSLIIYKPFNF
jgi:hypothetical protein